MDNLTMEELTADQGIFLKNVPVNSFIRLNKGGDLYYIREKISPHSSKVGVINITDNFKSTVLHGDNVCYCYRVNLQTTPI